MNPIPANKKINPILVFFVIHSSQIGIGILGFQREIAKKAGYDSWMAVILAIIGAHVILYIMFKIAEFGKGDIIQTHYFVYGKIVGRVFNIFLIVYFVAYSALLIRSYIQIIQIWMFPDLNSFWFALALLLIAMYFVFGGFRTVSEIAFFSVILPSYLILAFFFAIPFSDYTDFQPIFSHSLKDIMWATYHMSITIKGYETLLLFYPFIEKPNSAKKWAHYGILFSGLVYLFIVIISFGYYSQPQLQHHIWATLSIYKIVKLPFLWRFDYIGISMYSLIILSNLCLALWCASRIMKFSVKLKQKKAIVVLAIIILTTIPLMETNLQIETYMTMLNTVGFSINFVYIPLLFIILLIVRKVKKA